MKKSEEAEEKREKKKIRKGKEKNKRENTYIDIRRWDVQNREWGEID